MTCREVIELLMDYLSGELPPDQRVVFDEHLAACPECVAYVKSYEDTVRLGKGVFPRGDEPISEEVPEDLAQAILAARRGRSTTD